MTFNDIKDLPHREVNELLGRLVEDGKLSRPDGWRLMDEHIDYHKPDAVIKRLKAKIASDEQILLNLSKLNDELLWKVWITGEAIKALKHKEDSIRDFWTTTDYWTNAFNTAPEAIEAYIKLRPRKLMQ